MRKLARFLRLLATLHLFLIYTSHTEILLKTIKENVPQIMYLSWCQLPNKRYQYQAMLIIIQKNSLARWYLHNSIVRKHTEKRSTKWTQRLCYKLVCDKPTSPYWYPWLPACVHTKCSAFKTGLKSEWYQGHQETFVCTYQRARPVLLSHVASQVHSERVHFVVSVICALSHEKV